MHGSSKIIDISIQSLKSTATSTEEEDNDGADDTDDEGQERGREDEQEPDTTRTTTAIIQTYLVQLQKHADRTPRWCHQ